MIKLYIWGWMLWIIYIYSIRNCFNCQKQVSALRKLLAIQKAQLFKNQGNCLKIFFLFDKMKKIHRCGVVYRCISFDSFSNLHGQNKNWIFFSLENNKHLNFFCKCPPNVWIFWEILLFYIFLCKFCIT